MSVNAVTVTKLLSALESDEAIALKRRARRARWVAVVLSLVVYATTAAGGLLGLWWAWRSDNWSGFWASSEVLVVWCALPLILLLTARRTLAPPSETIRRSAQSLREVAAQGDDRLAPPTLLQPVPLDGAALPAGPLRIGPLKPLAASPYGSAVAILLVVLFSSVVFFPMLTLSVDGPATFVDFVPWAGAIPFLIMVVVIVSLPLGSRSVNRQRLYVTVDERGLEWQTGGRGRKRQRLMRVEWDQVRSLSRFGFNPFGAFGPTLYMVDTPDGQLLWTAGAAGSAASEQAQAASEMLLRVVVTRTGKPLRDLSAVASELARTDGTALRLAGPALAGGALPGQAVPYSGVYPPPSARARRRPAIGIIMALLVSVLLLGGIYGGAAWLHAYQSQYYAGIPARIHASFLRFQDDLAVPDGYWDVSPPTEDTIGGASYVGATYQLSGIKPDYYHYELESLEFGDAAYQVTASERGAVPRGTSDGVGLVLHAARNEHDFLVFSVDREGDWTFWKYHHVDDNWDHNWTYLDGERSSTIRTGDGDANRLLVLVHGEHYLFFVNDQYVGSHQATNSEDLPSYGEAGLYLGETATTGVFTQFSVYAVPQTTWWDTI